MAELKALWQKAEVAELLPIEGCGGFRLKTQIYQIFSLDPEEDYEVNYHTIDGWKMMVNQTAMDYFAIIEALRQLNLVLDEKNGSILVDQLSAKVLAEIAEKARSVA